MISEDDQGLHIHHRLPPNVWMAIRHAAYGRLNAAVILLEAQMAAEMIAGEGQDTPRHVQGAWNRLQAAKHWRDAERLNAARAGLFDPAETKSILLEPPPADDEVPLSHAPRKCLECGQMAHWALDQVDASAFGREARIPGVWKWLHIETNPGHPVKLV